MKDRNNIWRLPEYMSLPYISVVTLAMITAPAWSQRPLMQPFEAPLQREERSNWPGIVRYSADGRIIAYGDNDGHVYLLDANTGQRLGVCDGSQPNKAQPMVVTDIVITKKQVVVTYQNRALGVFRRKGKFSIEATFVRRDGDLVVLRQTNGKPLTVPLSKLSTADRAYVNSQD